MQNTICALATGNGGAIAIIRLSGVDSLNILNQITHFEHQFLPRKQAFCTLYDNERVLDKALVTFFKGPNSFTGEDVVEFSIHASPYIKGRLLEILCEHGTRLANRGEFSQRAFLNQKMDLIEAQGLCDLISSSNKASHQLAMDSLDGRLSSAILIIKSNISELLAQIEVRLDDVDEEMPPLKESFIREKVETVLNKIKELADTFSVGRLIKDGLRVAIIGSPNSGKSSLLNALVGYDRVIVSEISGTTRDTVEEILEINEQKIILIDTAGIRDHVVDFAEKEGIKRSRKAINQADSVIFVLDSTRQMNPSEVALWEELQQKNNILIVFNKQDLVENFEVPYLFRDCNCVKTSCTSHDGIEKLKNLLTKDISDSKTSDGLMISNIRHYECLIKAQVELEELCIKLNQSVGGEILAEHLRVALLHLREVIGEVTSEDVLGIIFSKFCMGK